MSKKKNRYNIEYYNGFMINAISLFISSYFPIQNLLYHSLFSDYQVYNCSYYCFEQQISNKNVKKRAFLTLLCALPLQR